MTAALRTHPPSKEHASTMDAVWGIDVAAQLPPGRTVTLPAASLHRRYGATVALADAPVVGRMVNDVFTVDAAGTVIGQRIRAGALTPGTYDLRVLFTPSGTTNALPSVLTLVCAF